MDIVDYLYKQMLEEMKEEKQNKITALKHAKRMVDSGFKEMITQGEFKLIVDYINLNNKYRNTTVKYLHGAKLKGKKWVNFDGYMLKFGDTLVSLIRQSKTVYKNGARYEGRGSKEFVIGKNFDQSYTVKIGDMSLDKFDEKKDIEPVDIEALISEIEESYPRRHEGFTLYKTGENPNEEGQTRTSEENNIEGISQEIIELSNTATSLSAELQKTKAELAKAEAKNGQASDKLEETKG